MGLPAPPSPRLHRGRAGRVGEMRERPEVVRRIRLLQARRRRRLRPASRGCLRQSNGVIGPGIYDEGNSDQTDATDERALALPVWRKEPIEGGGWPEMQQ